MSQKLVSHITENTALINFWLAMGQPTTKNNKINYEVIQAASHCRNMAKYTKK